MSKELHRIYAADIAVYSIYERTTLENGFAKMSGYFGKKGPMMFSNVSDTNWSFAPRVALIDLRTMKYIAVEDYSTSYSVSELIELCEAQP